jgi:hypothetical protein
MKQSRLLRMSILGFGSLAFTASGAVADWLVTQEGDKVEINGPWKVEGQLVTFTLPNGTLGSMRLSAVDLDASQALTEKAAAQPAPAQPKPRRRAEFVLTDADVSHPRIGDSADAIADSEEAAGSEASPQLRVAGWREEVDLSTSSVTVTGNLQNPTQNPATSIALDVMLYGEDGTLLETSRADLERGFLNPGASVRFEARFTDTLSFDSVEFDIKSRGFLARPPDDETGSSEDEGQEEGGAEEDQA